MELKDPIALLISLLAVGISAATFFYARIQEWRSGQASIIKALQGEKEAVAYVAYKVRSRRWDKRFQGKKFRQDIISALCLAWSLESSDRAKALIFDTLKKIIELGFKNEICPVLNDLYRQFTEYKQSFNPCKFEKRIEEVKSLMQELQIEVHPIVKTKKSDN
jgi:hypothetical protein